MKMNQSKFQPDKYFKNVYNIITAKQNIIKYIQKNVTTIYVIVV
jgi:hypothetical protein